MKVAIYARVSKDEVASDGSYQDPENQLHAIRKYCKAKEWEVVEEYVDRMSGANANRPKFIKMRSMAEFSEKGYEAIVVYKLDRFSREPMNVMLSYIQKLKEQKIGLISVTESWLDTRKDNPVSELILAIMAWFCAEERRKISERTKAALERKKKEGMSLGRPKGSKDKKKRRMSGYYKRYIDK